MNFVFKYEDSQNFEKLWNQYLTSYNVDFQYSLTSIEYYLAYCNNLYKDKSFILEVDNHCVGICFLPIESTKDGFSISIANGYIMAPLAKSLKYEQIIFDCIDKICDDLNIVIVKFKVSIFENLNFNRLRLYRFLDTTNTTCILDLNNSQEDLWMNLRKRYKSLINSLTKNGEYSIVCSNESTLNELHKYYVTFHKIHMKNAGKSLKSNLIYTKQLNLAQQNLATIIAVNFQNHPIIINYFFHDTTNVVYASNAYDTHESFKNLPLNHYLLWHSTLYFKQRGFKKFGFGQPCSLNSINGFMDYADEKELSISHFKRGMGTQMISHMQGIKFLKKEPLLQLIDQFKSEVTNGL
ncbi:hypothetical protein [Sulfurospirillum sp. UCH001]|uniref:hypothetical protein n=1 Tax=Sulfurospirillum sp. UCH001 TaxID=1581011 RepID=UPI000834B309|nr:hypothetical protein [Sulfurospirillum sp. UCH001]